MFLKDLLDATGQLDLLGVEARATMRARLRAQPPPLESPANVTVTRASPQPLLDDDTPAATPHAPPTPSEDL